MNARYLDCFEINLMKQNTAYTSNAKIVKFTAPMISAEPGTAMATIDEVTLNAMNPKIQPKGAPVKLMVRDSGSNLVFDVDQLH